MFESRARPNESADSIASAILSQARTISAGMARLLGLVATFDRIEGFRAWGSASTSEWLAWKCGIKRMTAREYVRVARALERLARIRRAFENGSLSYAKVRALTRVAEPSTEGSLLRMAATSSAAELEKTVRELRAGRAAVDSAFARRNRSVRMWIDDEGMHVLLARLPVLDGARVRAGLQAIARGVSAETDDDLDGSPPGERQLADALVELVRRGAGPAASDEAARSRPEFSVLVHIDTREKAVRLSDGTRLSPSAAERVLCDATLTRVEHRPGRTIKLYSSNAVVPPRLRTTLELRDRTCRFPGCHNRVHLEAHHRRPWSRGRPTNEQNLDMLCTHHHDFVHSGDCRLERDVGGRLKVVFPDGRILRHHDYSTPPTALDAVASMAGRREPIASMSGAS